MNELIEKFFVQQLTPQEAITLLKMLQKEDISEELYLTAMIRDAFSSNSDNEFRGILKEIEYEEQNRHSLTQEQLQNCFTPINEYENNLEGTTRGSQLQIIAPKNNINCIDSLYFEWNSAHSYPLMLVIENNDYDELLRLEVPARINVFEVSLSNSNKFSPGRFYWKLTAKQQELLAMGVFFIGKGLVG